MSQDTGEHVNPKIANLIDAELTRKAGEFEEARVARLMTQAEERERRFRRIQLQFWFLFGFLVIAVLLLAYRTENNDANLRHAQVIGCERRAEQARVGNEGRRQLITFVMASPTNAALSQEQKDSITKQLSQGLILPIEDCAALAADG